MDDNKISLEKDVGKEMEESYTSDFYSNSVKDIVNIADKNKDNPAQLSMEASAYIDGVSKNIPTLDKEKISKPLTIMANSYTEQATEDAAILQTENAENKSIGAAFDSLETLNYVTKNNHPQKVQAVAESVHLRNMRMLVENGKLTADEAMKMTENYTTTLVSTMYRNVISDKDLSEKDAIEFRERMLNGTTGDESIDSLPYQMRKEAVIRVENEEKELQNGLEELKQRKRYATQSLIEDRLIEIDSSDMSDYDKQMELIRLRSIAQTPEQKQFIDNWDKDDWEPTERVSLIMEEAERSGRANKEFYRELLKNKFISIGAYRKKMLSLDDYLNQSLNSGEYRQYNEQLKADFGYVELGSKGENEAYHKARSAYINNLAALGRKATPAEHKAAYDAAIKQSGAYKGAVDAKRDEKITNFYDEYGISVDKFKTEYYEKTSSDLFKNGTLERNDSEQKKNTAIYGALVKRLIDGGLAKNKDQANKMIADFKKTQE